MTTLKEYKAMMESATDAPWLLKESTEKGVGDYIRAETFGFVCRMPDIWGTENGFTENKHNARFIAASRNIAPELIRVIELAEEALLNAMSCVPKNTEDKTYSLIIEQANNTISEIRKLKGD